MPQETPINEVERFYRQGLFHSLYLLERPLLLGQLRILNSLDRIEDKAEMLHKWGKIDKEELNQEAINILKESKIIIYSNTSVYSNLLPSFIPPSVGEIIKKAKAIKILIANPTKENEPNETTTLDQVRIVLQILSGRRDFTKKLPLDKTPYISFVFVRSPTKHGLPYRDRIKDKDIKYIDTQTDWVKETLGLKVIDVDIAELDVLDERIPIKYAPANLTKAITALYALTLRGYTLDEEGRFRDKDQSSSPVLIGALVNTIIEEQRPQAAATALFGYKPIDIAITLVHLANELKQKLIQDKSLETHIEQFYRAVIRESLELEDKELAQKLQIIAMQSLNIIFWIQNNVPGADKLKVTLAKDTMLTSDKGESYLDISEFHLIVASTGKEFTPGFYWRGSEGAKKLGEPNIRTDFVYDQLRFAARKDNVVMYIMDHGFIAVPAALVEITGKAENQISTIHDTSFTNDLLPGSLQLTSTGVGHLQAMPSKATQLSLIPTLDIKQVTEGEGIQFNILYDSKGNILEILAQYLIPGTWTLALPGYVDSMVNLGGLRFNDFSIGLDEETAKRFNPRFDSKHEIKPNPVSPYLAVYTSEKPFLIKQLDDALPIQWIKGPAQEIFGEKLSLLNLYQRLTPENKDALVANLIKSLPAIEEVAKPVVEVATVEAIKERINQINDLHNKALLVEAAMKFYAWGGNANKIVLELSKDIEVRISCSV